MLSNSVLWKKELLRAADRLEKKATQRRWTEQSAFRVEKDVMVGAYAIRKLLEAPAKLSDCVKELRLPVSAILSLRLLPLTGGMRSSGGTSTTWTPPRRKTSLFDTFATC